MTTLKATKKPLSVEAMQFTHRTKDMCFHWVGCNVSAGWTEQHEPYMKIQSTEGIMDCHLHDFIIKGTAGEVYVCKYSVFLSTYDFDANLIEFKDK